ncbi:hypothetical protein [Bordetella genomosp. 4]|uniref:hypothetical protein n=1 Tax=Bordetella genomosp. 4 TaxID=463044 RepID=UPI000B9E6EC5|nr:hypothetical protein [Bordetella genomosp. 4]
MYRLPNQFDPSGRQDNLSAAGGGSTSTTCSSCIVTVGIASVATSSIFSGLVPEVLARRTASASTPTDASGASSTVGATEPSASAPTLSAADDVQTNKQASVSHAPAPMATPETGQHYDARLSAGLRQPMSKGERRTMGALSIVLAAIAGVIGFLIQPLFGAIAFCAVYIGIFCVVYERSNRSAGHGAAVALVMLIGIVACAALEMYFWIESM